MDAVIDIVMAGDDPAEFLDQMPVVKFVKLIAVAPEIEQLRGIRFAFHKLAEKELGERISAAGDFLADGVIASVRIYVVRRSPVNGNGQQAARFIYGGLALRLVAMGEQQALYAAFPAHLRGFLRA